LFAFTTLFAHHPTRSCIKSGTYRSDAVCHVVIFPHQQFEVIRGPPHAELLMHTISQRNRHKRLQASCVYGQSGAAPIRLVYSQPALVCFPYSAKSILPTFHLIVLGRQPLLSPLAHHSSDAHSRRCSRTVACSDYERATWQSFSWQCRTLAMAGP
jgi:hypothetical protein